VKTATFLEFLVPTFNTKEYSNFSLFFKKVLYTADDWNPNIVKKFIVSFFDRKSILYQRDTTNDRDKII